LLARQRQTHAKGDVRGDRCDKGDGRIPGKGNKDKSVKKTLKSNLKLIGIFSNTNMALKKD